MDKRTILLVDDELMVRNVFSKFLIEKGYNVETAVDGEDALTKIQGINSSIYGIISDVDMPNLNGVEMAKRLEADGKNYPLIFMSGNFKGKIEYMGKKLKPLQKPVAFSDLEKAIKGAFH